MVLICAKALVVAICCSYCSAAETILANSSRIIWQGRTLAADEPTGAVRFSWEGVQAMFAVRNASQLDVRLASTFDNRTGVPRFRVFVDGILQTNLTIERRQETTYTLVDDMDPTSPHNVTLWFISDPISLTWDDLPNQWMSLSGFSTDGWFGPAPDTRVRRLQIIGDSITAGDSLNCPADFPDPSGLPDHSSSYGAKLCERFSANCTTLAVSGKGLYKNCCDSGITMLDLWQRTLVGDPTSLFSNSDFVPDAVLLNLGTNDQTQFNGTEAWSETFTEWYADFLVSLTVVHRNPSLPIFCGVGPIVTNYGAWVREAMTRAYARGALSLHYIDFGGCIIDGCNGHPGYSGHQQMFEIAAPIIGNVLDWSPPVGNVLAV